MTTTTIVCSACGLMIVELMIADDVFFFCVKWCGNMCVVCLLFSSSLSLSFLYFDCLFMSSLYSTRPPPPPTIRPPSVSQLKLFYAPLLSLDLLSLSLDSGLVQAPTLPPFRLPPTHLSIHSVAVCGSNAPLASTCPSLLHHHSLRTTHLCLSSSFGV